MVFYFIYYFSFSLTISLYNNSTKLSVSETARLEIVDKGTTLTPRKVCKVIGNNLPTIMTKGS
jgi:hypothetical protein